MGSIIDLMFFKKALFQISERIEVPKMQVLYYYVIKVQIYCEDSSVRVLQPSVDENCERQVTWYMPSKVDVG